MNAISLRPRSVAALVLVSVIGLLAFTWPLLLPGSASTDHTSDAPLLFALLLVLMLAVLLAELSEGGLDSKAIALLGVLAAVGTVLRPLSPAVAGFELVFFLFVLAGRAFGPGFGFCLGAVTLFSSAVVTGGVGPWLPFQMLGAGWFTLGAGLLPHVRGGQNSGRWWRRFVDGTRGETVLLAVYGAFGSVAYGFLLNLWFWPTALGSDSAVSFVAGDPLTANLHRFLIFCLLTSLGFDLPRAVVTAVMVIVVGPGVLRALRRAGNRASFGAGGRFIPPTPVDAGTPVDVTPVDVTPVDVTPVDFTPVEVGTPVRAGTPIGAVAQVP